MIDLNAALKHEIDSAKSEGDLSEDRADAWDMFLGEVDAVGEGKSNVVSSDLADVIDWIMPEVVRAFGAGEAGVEFAAQGKDDENQAENETKAVAYIFFRENNGLVILHNWFQEIFLQKVGYLHPYYDDTPEYETGSFDELNEMEFQALSMQAEITSDEVIEVEDELGTRILHNVEYRIERTAGKVVIDQLPTDNTLVNHDHKEVSLKSARLAAHERIVTQSELIEMGYERKQVENLPTWDEIEDEEDEARYNFSDERDDEDPVDPSQRKIKLIEGYWLVDANEDGISERYWFQYAGNEILQKNLDDTGLIVAGSAMPLANKHMGRSLFEKVEQIQQIKTFFLRQMVENIAQINNSRYAAVESKVNLRDLLNNKPASVVRVKAPGMIEPLKVMPIGPDVYQFMEYLDKIRTERTGVGPEIVTELGELANSTAWGVERLMTKKEELVGLIIAMLRATGVNELFERIHEIMRENIKQPIQVPVEGQWIVQNPSQWPKRKAVPPMSWSGLGDKLEKQRTLSRVIEFQEKIAMSPASWMVEEKHVYESMSDLARASGVTNISQYFHDPQSEEGMMAKQRHMQMLSQQQQDDPLSKSEMIKGEYQKQIAQIREQSAQQIKAVEFQVDQQKEQQRLMKEQQDADLTLKKLIADIEARSRELDQRDRDLMIKEQDLNRRASVDEHKMMVDDAELALKQESKGESATVAQINADAQVRIAEVEASKQIEESKPQEIHIHNTGGKKKIKVVRTANGIEGTTETEDE